jgi:hypothetical protein
VLGTVLVGLVGKYVGEVLLGKDECETYLVRVVQYGERGESAYYEATCTRLERRGQVVGGAANEMISAQSARKTAVQNLGRSIKK